MERSGGLPTTQFAYRKGLGACDALLVSHYYTTDRVVSGACFFNGTCV